MEIRNPRRILILSPPDTNIEPVKNALCTPSIPANPQSKSAKPKSNKKTPEPIAPDANDLVHSINTPYYTASIPIWLDTVLPTPTSLLSFKNEWLGLAHPSSMSPFSAPDPKDIASVLAAIGAWILVFPKPATKEGLQALEEMLKTVGEVATTSPSTRPFTSTGAGSYYGADSEPPPPLLLALGLKAILAGPLALSEEEWEDRCREAGGWEWIDGEISVEAGGRRAGDEGFGETKGLARLREALESGEWEQEDGEREGALDWLDGGNSEGEGEEGTRKRGKGLVNEVEDEEVGMRESILHLQREGVGEGEESDDDVEELQKMMVKMQAIRDMGAGLPASERKKLAAKAVADIMKTL